MANAKLGAALVGGYLLGRTKKGKSAVKLALWLSGKELNPRQLVKLISQSPVFGELSRQAREELLEAGKNAATSALTTRADRLADTLHERTAAMQRGEAPGEAPAGDEKEPQKPRRSGSASRKSGGEGSARSKPRRSAEDG